jgi:hypothetical protein
MCNDLYRHTLFSDYGNIFGTSFLLSREGAEENRARVNHQPVHPSMQPVKLKLDVDEVVDMHLDGKLQQDAGTDDDDDDGVTDDSSDYRLPLSLADLAAISARPASERVAAKAAREQQALADNLFALLSCARVVLEAFFL